MPDFLLQHLSENEISQCNRVIFKLIDRISALLDNVGDHFLIDAFQHLHLDLPDCEIPLLLLINFVQGLNYQLVQIFSEDSAQQRRGNLGLGCHFIRSLRVCLQLDRDSLGWSSRNNRILLLGAYQL